jgi:hypothetical protein
MVRDSVLVIDDDPDLASQGRLKLSASTPTARAVLLLPYAISVRVDRFWRR